MVSFIQLATTESNYDPKQLKEDMTREDVAERLRAAYMLRLYCDWQLACELSSNLGLPAAFSN